MKNIYGTIGYTVLEFPKTNKKLLVLADMHDTLPGCDNKTNISDWFKSKFDSSQILLEEVPRENLHLKELWSQSIHTQQLKELFLNNNKTIHPVDIRPFLIPFSWEILGLNLGTSLSMDHTGTIINLNTSEYDMTLSEYLRKINNFFCLKDSYLLTKLPNYRIENLAHTKLGKHFIKIKRKFLLILLKNKSILKQKLGEIYKNNIQILENINDLLNEIMEWYICACIDLYKHKPVIIHTGLAHSEQVVEWLINYYGFKLINSVGINKLSDTQTMSMNGCVKLPTDLEKQFGGFSGFFN